MVRLIVAVIIIAGVVMLFGKAAGGVSGGTWGVTGPPVGSSGAGMKTAGS